MSERTVQLSHTAHRNILVLCDWLLTTCEDAPREIKKVAFQLATETPGIMVGPYRVETDAFLEIQQAVRDQKKIQAIKVLRVATGCPLKDAKDTIEAEFYGSNQTAGGTVP